MKEIVATGEKVCESREEIAEKYFDGFSIYNIGNMGIVTLLSDLQHEIAALPNKNTAEHYRQILNDVKCVLIGDDRKNREGK